MPEGSERIHRYGNPVLRKRSEPVTEFDDNLRAFVNRMADLMYEGNGIGLAAPQVGMSRRLVIVDLSFGEEVDRILAMANPEILEREGESTMEEGCLSVPGVFEDVVRAERIRVRYQDVDGREIETDAEGFLARIMQHEIDHLDGILFVDRIGPVKRALLAGALRGIAEEEGDGT